MYEILIKVFVSAAGALIWCLLITFCCMCIEHLFFKKQMKPRLTDKEIILIKEVLAGNISLSLVANDGLFVECVDRIEQIFERFISRSKQQMEQMEKISKNLDAKYEGTILKNDYTPESFTIEEEPLDIVYPEVKLTSGVDIKQMIDRIAPPFGKAEKGHLLEEPIYRMELPKPFRQILRKQLGCNTVKDVLELMLYAGSRKGLLEIRRIGEISADRLETFMFDNGLIYLQGYDYKSKYADVEIQHESN